MKGPVKKRVFLVGCARSGTTMLQALLAGHPQIASFPETHFFEKSLPGFAALFSRGFKMHSVLSEWIRLNPVLNLPVHTVGRHWSRKSMVHEFKKVMDNLTKESEKEIWVEKTPGHIMHLDFIEKHFSDAAFIHIMRDGRAVIASLYEVTRKYPEEWGGERPLLECIHEWNERVLKSFQKREKGNHFFVFYHNLTYDTETELQQICQFLNIQYDSGMTKKFKHNLQRVAKEDQPWMKQKQNEIFDGGYQKFSSIFTEDEKKTIERKLVFPDISKIEKAFLKKTEGL